MDRAEAYKIAQDELGVIDEAGYIAALEHIDTVALKDVTSPSGRAYEIELSYLWRGPENEDILVVCRVISKSWFTHQQLEESITLCPGAI